MGGNVYKLFTRCADAAHTPVTFLPRSALVAPLARFEPLSEHLAQSVNDVRIVNVTNATLAQIVLLKIGRRRMIRGVFSPV